MKKLIAVVAGAFIIFSASSFAYKAPEAANETVVSVFNTGFAGATNVSWTEKSSLYFADFTFEGKTMTAAYNEEGRLLGTSRIIAKAAVPGEILKTTEAAFHGKSTPYVVEINHISETTYYFDIISDKYIIKCNTNAEGNVTETSRVKLQK